ncbi:hypothetical protein Asp14428_21290 [Actinoplanes sp. NBRC 14428]|nr:hypothetical protein Asp14428_21290 [Actinoplanes sp. NBRC 14428]
MVDLRESSRAVRLSSSGGFLSVLARSVRGAPTIPVAGRALRPVLLTGLTGSGKTGLLHGLRRAGEQVLDLEKLAAHRGSAFGAAGPQPTHRDFTRAVLTRLSTADPDRPLWMEYKGGYLGSVGLPAELSRAFAVMPLVRVERPSASRAAAILAGYAALPAAGWLAGVARIETRLGGARAAAVRTALGRGELRTAIELLLDYYDRTYAPHLAALGGPVLHQLASATDL